MSLVVVLGRDMGRNEGGGWAGSRSGREQACNLGSRRNVAKHQGRFGSDDGGSVCACQVVYAHPNRSTSHSLLTTACPRMMAVSYVKFPRKMIPTPDKACSQPLLPRLSRRCRQVRHEIHVCNGAERQGSFFQNQACSKQQPSRQVDYTLRVPRPCMVHL